MSKALLLLAFALTPSTLFALPSTQTLQPVADAKVFEGLPGQNLGSDTTLRVRKDTTLGRYRSYLRFDLRGLSGDVTSAKLRLFCTDESPSGGALSAIFDTSWPEGVINWANKPTTTGNKLASLGAVAANTWVEMDVTESVKTGQTRVFLLSEGSSSNSAFYSSREGAHPPELVLTTSGGGGGSNPPVVAFSGAPLQGDVPLQTVFSDQTTGQVTTWLWNFGDGSVSTARNPVHLYSNAGTYTVTLSVVGPGGTNSLSKSGYVRAQSASAQGIWTSARELASLPTSGSAWNALLSSANGSTSAPSVINQDDNTDVRVLAKALVFARTGNQTYRSQVIDACMKARGTEVGGRTLALARNLIGYVLAADLVDLPATEDAAFRTWLRVCLTENLDGQTLRSTHEDRPNNWGTHAGASRLAVALYLGDNAEVDRCARVFRGWLGDRSAYAGFAYGDLSWQADASHPVGINPRGATKNGHSIDGVLPDDQRRAGGFVWPPPKENYVWEAMQGALAQAVMLSRAGYSPWEWSDQALLRAVTWLHTQDSFPAGGDDTWEPHVINYFYAANFPAPVPSSPGKNVGFTDWMYR